MVTIKHSTGTFRIGLILIDGFALMSYSSIVEPLRAANLLSRRAYYDIKYIPVTGSWANSSSGASVKATGRVGQEGDLDLEAVIKEHMPLILELDTGERVGCTPDQMKIFLNKQTDPALDRGLHIVRHTKPNL